MPYTESNLPYQGSVPLSRSTSLAGAESAKDRAPSQLIRMIVALLDAPDGLTDHDLARILDIPLASVCARRAPLRNAGLVYCEGVRSGATGEPNALWRFRR